MVAAAGCDDSEPEIAREPTVSSLRPTTTATHMPTTLTSDADTLTPAATPGPTFPRQSSRTYGEADTDSDSHAVPDCYTDTNARRPLLRPRPHRQPTATPTADCQHPMHHTAAYGHALPPRQHPCRRHRPTPTATVEELVAELLPWAGKLITSNQSRALEAIVTIWELDPGLGAAVAQYPWLGDDVDYSEASTLALLAAIAGLDLELAWQVSAWVAGRRRESRSRRA